VLAEIVVPAGVAAAAGIALAATIPPHWRAAGMPYFLGYGKNVELAAVAGGLAAGAATQWCVRSRRGLAACALLAAAGLALAASVAPLPPLVAGWPQLLAVAVLATALGAGRRERPPEALPVQVPPAQSAPDRDLPGLVAAALAGGLALAVAAFLVGPPLLTIDTYHHGEVLSTAVDLLRGGRPFETLIWPHGLHDTGLAALWILITGKVGTSPVALARATCCGLGVVAVYVLARRLLGSRMEALAACSVAALAPLLTDQPQTGPGAFALYQLGESFFVILGFAAITSPPPRRPPGSALLGVPHVRPGCAAAGASRPGLRGRLSPGAGRRELLAGLCLGLAYLFRIETAIYGSLAALAVIAWRELVAAGEPFARAALTAAGRALQLVAGAALVLGAARLLAGWPGIAWYAYTLWELPRYHRDAMGVLLPWPRRGEVPSPPVAEWLARALARMLLTLLLLVQAVRAVAARRCRREPPEDQRTAQLLFVAVFEAAALKSGLERGDPGHVLQWSAVPLLAAACLAAAGLRERWSASRRLSSVAVLLLIVVLDFENLGLQVPAPRGADAIAAAARERWQGLVEHLSPNPPAGACADRTFTPAESRLASNRGFIAGTCAVEALLRSHGVSRLVIADSASWYYVRFGLPFPTRYFAMARAYTPPRQLELVDQLRARRPQALLLADGYGALREFDVPDAVRVPVVDAYLRARRHGVGATPTPLGDLFFWDKSPSCGAAARAGGGGGRGGEGGAGRAGPPLVETVVAAYQPASGVLFARGWAIDAATRRPLADLALGRAPPGAAAVFESGLTGAAAPVVEPGPAPRHDGWELWVRGWTPGAAQEAFCVDATGGADSGARSGLGTSSGTAAGPPGCVKLELAKSRVLGPLEGAEWTGLGAAVERAWAMGRADRLRAQAGRPAPCAPPG
jgi:hypothetical protein